MKTQSDKEQMFIEIIGHYKEVVAKVCSLYVSPTAAFEDLYQEVLINIWQGMETYRGEAKVSTWIYRTAINTCITWYRRNSRHGGNTTTRLEDLVIDPADTSDTSGLLEEYRELYNLIAKLGPIDKALITLWLEEKTYDEISHIMGISPSNVAVRIHRIKEKLSKMAER